LSNNLGRKEPRERPLLIVISESPDLPADVRARRRDVRRWTPDTARASDECFIGDPSLPATYEWAEGARAVTAVIDLCPVQRARDALHALRTVRPDAAVLLLSKDASDLDKPYDGTLARGGELRDVLRLDLEEELERLEAERRVYCLRTFAEGADIVPILIHADPDPDAVSSALAVVELLGGSHERTPIVALTDITRPENRRMVELLHIQVTVVTEAELRHFDRIITVDTQPRGLQREGKPRVAVIDHHPIEHDYDADFFDVRPEYGSAAAILTEYLRASPQRDVSKDLATALLFGMKTDTDSLMRGVTPADVTAYAFLQSHADLQLVRRFERPSYRAVTAQSFGSALATANCDGELCVAYLGEITTQESHALADLADFCLSIENVTWVASAAVVDGRMVMSIRHTGTGTGAGVVARRIAEEHNGEGGGHATMARVTLDEAGTKRFVGSGEVVAEIRRIVDEAMGAQRN